MNIDSLRNEVRAGAEERPGVYRWLGPDGTILYVGKSVRVRSRLLSYFRKDVGKEARIVRASASVQWDYVPNEFAALFHEMHLIRAWQPEYNTQHKRDRRYGFVKITREPAPRMIPVARVHNDGARYYGPFGQKAWLSRAVHDLSLATGLRDCGSDTPVHFADQLEIFASERTPHCIRADTGTCLAPCAGRCTASEYNSRLEIARAFLETRNRAPLETLVDLLKRATERLDFGYAARLRDRMETLEKLWDHLSGCRGQVAHLNLVYAVPGFGGDDRLYLIRRGRLWGEIPWPRTYAARRRARATVTDAFRPILDDRDASLDADSAAEVLMTVSWLNKRPGERRRARPPEQWLAGRHAAFGRRSIGA